MRKPFYWKSRKAWYVKSDDGKSQTYLADDEDTAYDVWKELTSVEHPTDPNTPVAAIAENFLRWAIKHVASSTYAQYSRYVASFCEPWGGLRARELKPFHVTKWLENKTWGDSGKRTAVTAVKRCFAWAVEEGLLNNNPLQRVRRPAVKRRERLITDDEHALMMQASDDGRKPGKRLEKKGERAKHRAGAFRQVLVALRHSGTRPGMIAAVTVENVTPDIDAWILHDHKMRGKTGKPLIIRLSPCLQTLTRILLSQRDSGRLFLNSSGQPWTRNAIRCRMRSMRLRLGLEPGAVAYAYRHTYATNAMVNGVDVATVAELLGHTDLRMVSQVYGHLEKQPEHLKQAAAKAVRKQA